MPSRSEQTVSAHDSRRCAQRRSFGASGDEHDQAYRVRKVWKQMALKTLIVNAPDALRESLNPLTDKKLIDCCAVLVAGDILDPDRLGLHRSGSRQTLAHPGRRDPDTRRRRRRDHSASGADAARSIRHWCGLRGGDDDCRRRQSDKSAFRGRVRKAMWCVPDSHLERQLSCRVIG